MRLNTIDDVFISIDDSHNLSGEFVPNENMAKITFMIFYVTGRFDLVRFTRNQSQT